MKLVLIPPGEFQMGSTAEDITAEIERAKNNPEWSDYFDLVPTEGPRHRVKITKPFYMATYPVTQGEYKKVMDVNPSTFTAQQTVAPKVKELLPEREGETRENDANHVADKDTRRHPVETVSWDNAMEFCSKLSAIPSERAAGRVYRLPTEAEWEYACRAGTTTRYHSGDDEAGLVEYAWFNKNSDRMTHPVGQKCPNAWGLHDMHGSVWQWCADWFDADFYKQSPSDDPAGPALGSKRVLRGGSWCSFPSSCRSARRLGNSPTYTRDNRGFRVRVEIAPKQQGGNQPATPTAPSTAGGSNARPPGYGTMAVVRLPRAAGVGFQPLRSNA